MTWENFWVVIITALCMGATQLFFDYINHISKNHKAKKISKNNISKYVFPFFIHGITFLVISIIIVVFSLSFDSIVELVFKDYSKYTSNGGSILVISIILLFIMLVKIVSYLRKHLHNDDNVGDGGLLFIKNYVICIIISILLIPVIFNFKWVWDTINSSLNTLAEIYQSLTVMYTALIIVVILYLIAYIYIIESHVFDLVLIKNNQKVWIIGKANEYIKYKKRKIANKHSHQSD